MTATTDPSLRSFLDIPPESEFPIQNLPWGVFVPQPGDPPRCGVAIGAYVLDLGLLEERGLLGRSALRPRDVFRRPTLDAFMSLGPAAWNEARGAIQRLLRADVRELRDDAALRDLALVARDEVELCLPCTIGHFTDFYASEVHATNVGRIFRGPDAALPPQYRYLPIAYQGRGTTVVASGTPIPRPQGQYRPEGHAAPVFGLTTQLDHELEIGIVMGRGNEWGRPLSPARALNHVFGLVLLNDWSARDIQKWEYQPLGPFQGKSFATTISPWIVPLAALEPFRCGGPQQEAELPAYLRVAEPRAYDIQCSVQLAPADGAATEISRSNARDLYWSVGQMVAHHTVNGCNLRAGDLLGTGTISSPGDAGGGCLLELTRGGAAPLQLPDGGERVYLADGDTVTLHGRCAGEHYGIGFGPCTGQIATQR
jgi:fumarylacetoacetase